MDKLTIPVKQRKIMGVYKHSGWILYSIIVWLFVTLILFGVFFATDNLVMLLVAFGSFICIIPLFIVNLILSREYRGDRAWYNSEVVLQVKDNELFAGDIKIPNIVYYSKEKYVLINDTQKLEINVKGVPVTSNSSSFIGVIEEMYVDEFLKFVRSNGIEVAKKK